MNEAILKLNKVLNEIKVLLPDFKNIVIAGGSVRDALMGRQFKDIDVFLLHPYVNSDWRNISGFIKDRLFDSFKEIKPKIEFHKSEPFLITSIQYDNSEVQVMLKNLNTVDELLDTFDWNVCLFALSDGKVYQRENIENIKPGGELWLQRVTFPKATLRRGFRFSDRFLMKFRSGEIEKLCKLILDNEAKKLSRTDR